MAISFVEDGVQLRHSLFDEVRIAAADVRHAAGDTDESLSAAVHEFRKGLRDALEKVREVPATQGVFTYTATDHVGHDNRDRELTRIEACTWKLVP